MNATSGLYDLPFRNYDAALGRFFQVDPLAHYDHSVSPFAYAGNSPITFNDPTGLFTDYSTSWENPDYVYMRKMQAENMAMNATNWSRDSRELFGGAGGTISAVGYSDAQLRAMYRSEGGGYSSFGAWAAANLSSVGMEGREIQGTDGHTYSFNSQGQIGYWRDYGYEPGTGDVAVQSKRSEFIVAGDQPTNNNAPWYHFFADHQPGGDFLYELNKFNPLAVAVNSLSTYASGKDTYGVTQSKTTATLNLATIVPWAKVAAVLNPAQIANFYRFLSKIPANSISINIFKVGESKVFQATSPGLVPGSKAVYEKTVDAAGNTIQYYKTTFGPDGSVIHVADKLTGAKIFPN